MKKVSYVEFRRPVPIKPEWLYYFLYWLVMAMIFIIVAVVLSILPDKIDISLHFPLYFAIVGVVISAISVMLKSASYVRIHNDGLIEIQNMALCAHKKIYVSNLESVEASIYSHLFYEYFKVTLKLNNNNSIYAYIDNYAEFIEEIKKFNSNLMLPELPII